MKSYIGIKTADLCYKAYDLDQLIKGIKEEYIFSLNKNMMLEKTKSDSDCIGCKKYNYLLTEPDDNGSIQMYVEGFEEGEIQILDEGGEQKLCFVEGIYAGRKTLEIFPNVNSRSVNDMDLISLKFSDFPDWNKEDCVDDYKKWLSDLDGEMLMNFVKIYATDKHKEVSIRVSDKKNRSWRKIYSVRNSSPDEAFRVINTNMCLTENKLQMLNAYPEIQALFIDF